MQPSVDAPWLIRFALRKSDFHCAARSTQAQPHLQERCQVDKYAMDGIAIALDRTRRSM